VHAEDDHSRRRQLPRHPLGQVEPVHLGHGDVGQKDIGPVGLDQRQRLTAVARLGDDLNTVDALEQGADAGEDQPVVVGDQDADWFHARLLRGRP
jgi:hypothetical protein